MVMRCMKIHLQIKKLGEDNMHNNELCSTLEKKYSKSALTINEVADELGVEITDINELLKNNELMSKKIGSKIIIPIPSFAEYLSPNKANTVDNVSNGTLISNETIDIVGDDIDLSKGSITYVKQADLWLYQIDIGKTPEGKRIRKSKGFKTENEAKEALAKIIEELSIKPNSSLSNGNNAVINSNTNYHAYLNYYLSLELGRGTSRTRDGYFYAAGKISQELGDIPLRELTQDCIMKFLNKLKKKYAQSTLDKVYLFLNMTLKYAVEIGMLTKNPMKSISKPKTTKVKMQEYKAFNETEIHDLLQASKCYNDMYPIILLLLNTGMRPGELRALKIENVNFDEKTIHIENAATFTKDNVKIGDRAKIKEVISTTKSTFSVRTLSIPDVVVTELKKWIQYMHTSKEYKKARKSIYLFPGLDGDFIGASVLRNRFKKFLKNEGFDGDGVTLYRFRHTMCTTLIKKGVDIPTVQRIMGDNTTDVILKIYTSINSKDIKEASCKVHQYFESI